MNNFSPICPDANLVVRFVAYSDDTSTAQLWQRWFAEDRPLTAPTLITYEVTNALHRLARAGLINAQAARAAIREALVLPIALYEGAELHDQAMAIAAQFSLPVAYDAHYLALAEQRGAEFWTTDRRLANSVRPHLPRVHLVGE